MSDDDLKAELERLRKENEALKKGASEGVRLKVSEKGQRSAAEGEGLTADGAARRDPS